VYESDCKQQKYVPLENEAAFHSLEYFPAGNCSEMRTDTSLPRQSNIFSDTNDFDAILNEIVVVGLNGLGKF